MNAYRAPAAGLQSLRPTVPALAKGWLIASNLLSAFGFFYTYQAIPVFAELYGPLAPGYLSSFDLVQRLQAALHLAMATSFLLAFSWMRWPARLHLLCWLSLLSLLLAVALVVMLYLPIFTAGQVV